MCPYPGSGSPGRDDDISRAAAEPDAELASMEIEIETPRRAEHAVTIVDRGIEIGPTLDGERPGKREIGRGIIVRAAVQAKHPLRVASQFLPQGGNVNVAGEQRTQFIHRADAEV
jgi:hypothetical protein